MAKDGEIAPLLQPLPVSGRSFSWSSSRRGGRAQAGHVPYGHRTFGYRYVKHGEKGAHYEVDPEEAALVQRIFRLCGTEGLSVYAIAERLTTEDIPTPKDRMRTLPARVW